MAKRKPLSERSWWKLTVQIMTIVTGVSAAILAGVAISVGIHQLEEMQKRPFLSLAFMDISEGWHYSMFFPKEEVLRERVFQLGIVNTGPKFSEGGELVLAIPKFLEIDSVLVLIDALANFYVFTINYGDMLPGGGRVDPNSSKEMSVSIRPILRIAVNLTDDLKRETEEDKYLEWPFIYQIVTRDDEGLYPRRKILVYFGVDDVESQHRYIRENIGENLFNRKFRSIQIVE